MKTQAVTQPDDCLSLLYSDFTLGAENVGFGVSDYHGDRPHTHTSSDSPRLR